MTPKHLNIGLIVATLFLYFYVVDPLYSGSDSPVVNSGENISSLTEKRNSYDETLNQVPKIIDQANNAKKAYDGLSDLDKKNILVMVPTSINDIALINEVSNIVSKSGVTPDTIGIKDKGNGVYSVYLSFFTTYKDFKTVMTYWERSMRLLTLQSVTFSPGRTEEEPIKFTIELQTYYMK